MWSDVVDLRDFYESRLGQVARHLLRRRIRQTWPDLRGEAVLGLGYASPFMRQFIGEAGRVIALMPAQQGVLHWPPEGPNATALVDETDLPLPDASMDRVLLAHAVECSEHLRDMLKEVWRVLAGNGRLLVVAPNRRGIWARTDRTPVINYPYAKMKPILERLKKTGDVDKRHGARVHYANPINGGPVLPTMGANLSLLPAGFKGEPYRSTDGTVFAVADGKGTTYIDGKPFAWGVNDVFVVPPWKQYRHEVGSEDAVLFSISDKPAQQALGIWREGQ